MEQYKLRDDVFTYGKVGEASDRLKQIKEMNILLLLVITTSIVEHLKKVAEYQVKQWENPLSFIDN